MGLVSPLATKWILDSLDAGESLVLPVLILVGLPIVRAAVSWWQWVMLGTLAEDVVYEARTAMITRFIRAKVFALCCDDALESSSPASRQIQCYCARQPRRA
jgi:ATP-binding cassette subfamily B protein